MKCTLLAFSLLVVASSSGCGPGAEESAPPERDLGAVLASFDVDESALEVQHECDAGVIRRFDVDAERAIAIWEKLRFRTDDFGVYPVVCRDESGLLAEQASFNEASVEETLATAAGMGAPAWFQQRAGSDEEHYGGVDQGEWVEDAEPQSGWAVPGDVLTGEPAQDVSILLVPTTEPWQVLAHLHYGGWNECPAPESHVTVQRYWYERHGAEIVCVTGDVVEMRVARPPRDKAASQALAREQFLYSGGDLVYQGYGSLNALASALNGADYWYFWWD